MLKIVHFFILLCFLSGCTLIAPSQPKKHHDLLLSGANIIDVETGNIISNGIIAIDDDTISFVGTQDRKQYHSAVKEINIDGRYVIPGLWDMHVHIEGADLIEDNKALFSLYLAYGITTVRDAASDLGEQVLKWRDEIQQGKLEGPQIFTAGRKLEGIDSLWKGDLEIGTEQELHKMLDLLEKYKVDFVKVTDNTLAGPLFLKSVKAAKDRGFKVSSHVPYDLSIEELAQAGLSSIEHAAFVLRLGSDEVKVAEQIEAGNLTKKQAQQDYLLNFDQERAIKAYKELARTGIAISPTLIGGKQLAFLDENDHKDDAFLAYLTERFISNYQWRIDRMANDTQVQIQQRKDKYKLIEKQLPYLQQAGIMLLAGSDSAALNTYVYPALGLHEELILYQDAGLTPLEILQTATINGAKFMEKLDVLATIKSGKNADLVILNTNPLKDIKATQDIYSVINNGTYYDRNKLNAILEQVKQTRIELDEQRRN